MMVVVGKVGKTFYKSDKKKKQNSAKEKLSRDSERDERHSKFFKGNCPVGKLLHGGFDNFTLALRERASRRVSEQLQGTVSCGTS